MISEAGTSIKDLGADALLDLGGLKTRCSVQIKCTEHGHIIPCEICLHEDRVGSFCDACGKILDTPPLPGDRECSSVEQFNLTGRVAFETDALAALSERESKHKRKKESAIPVEIENHEPPPVPPARDGSRSPSTFDRTLPAKESGVEDSADRKVWEDFKRKHIGNYYVVPRRPRPAMSPAAPSDTDKAVDIAEVSPEFDHRPLRPHLPDSGPETGTDKRPRRKPAPKRSPDKTPPIYDTPTGPRSTGASETGDEKISLLSIWAALFAAIAGAYVLFHSPWVQGSTRSHWYALAFSATVLIIWFLSMVPLLGEERAHRTMPWWSPAAWAFLAAPWPAVGAYLLCKTGAAGQTLSEGIFVLIIGLAAALVLIYQVACCGIRLTMSPPWPVPLEGESETSDDWLWAKIIATIVMLVYLWDFGAAMWKTTATPTTEASFLTAPLGSLVAAVNEPKSYSRLRNGPELDRIAKALAVIDASPKPTPGDAEKARKLQKAAQALTNKGDWQKAYPLLLLAYKASPTTDSIGITLGLAESLTGRHDDARRHLTEALIINPRNSAGWRALGSSEIRREKGSELSIRRASEYYLVAWWFAQDRKRLQQLLVREADDNAAMKEAVKRVQKRISQ